ncbi:MAG TPA: mycothiol system anti-sigma-R factor [Acidimicrobiales bacterium]|nr:mycothiol system anti-sigma-R factor [Acidimicrobiales bacterium]
MRSDESQPIGDPSAEVDCRESLTEIYWFLDGELTLERRALIRQHLEACNGCLQTFDFEAELRSVVSSCCRERTLPPGLRDRIAQALGSPGEEP